MQGRPTVRELVQVAIVVPNIEQAVEYWSRLLGVEKPRIIETEEWEKTGMEYRGSPSRARAKLAFFRLSNITIELIEPIGEPSTWSEFLRRHGPGIHHIAINVDNIGDAVKYFTEELGAEVEQRGRFTGGGYVYVDAGKTLGARIELLYHEK